MNINNEVELRKFLLSFIEENTNAFVKDAAQELVSKLHDAFNSGEAAAFTTKINQMYKDKGIKDDVGNIVQIKPPYELISEANWDKNGLNAIISLSGEEDRWLRANKLYGDDLLGKLGFKYIDGQSQEI